MLHLYMYIFCSFKVIFSSSRANSRFVAKRHTLMAVTLLPLRPPQCSLQTGTVVWTRVNERIFVVRSWIKQRGFLSYGWVYKNSSYPKPPTLSALTAVAVSLVWKLAGIRGTNCYARTLYGLLLEVSFESYNLVSLWHKGDVIVMCNYVVIICRYIFSV